MADDSYTETTSQSWFSRLGNSVRGVVAGLVIFVLAFPVLYWNEGRTLERHETLEEGAGAVVSVRADAVDAANQGKLVHLSGPVSVADVLSDAEFNVSVKAVKLRRTVKMYQWQESSESKTEKKFGGSTETVTTYSYRKGWSEHLVHSGGFKQPEGHQNPASMEFQSREQVAKNVSLGAFRLPASLIARFNNFEPLSVDATTLPGALQSRAKPSGGGYFIGASPASPAIGDLQVSFESAPATTASVVARQIGTTLEPFHSSSGGSVMLLQVGTFSAESMFKQEESANTFMAWILRAVGFVMMYMGLGMILRPLSVVGDVVPLIGDVIGMGTGVVAFGLAAVFALVTIAVSWFAVRPVMAVVLLAVAGGLIFGLRHLAKKKKAAEPASA